MSNLIGTLQDKDGNNVFPMSIQSVSNSNGTALKFPDGTMICYKNVDFTGVDITSTWGNLYECGKLSFGDWAVPFVAKPVTSLDTQTQSGVMIESHIDVSATNAGACWLTRPNTMQGVSVTCSVIGFGRWK